MAHEHFRIAGIPVRVEPVFFVIAGLWGLRYIDQGLDIVLMWVLCSFVSILVHELGHGFALKAFGHRSAIVLHGFGGVTVSQRRSQLTKARSVFVSVAGSLTALLLLWLPIRTWFENVSFETFYGLPELLRVALYFLMFQNLWWSLFNLLPIRPMDGGNVLAEFFGMHNARRISVGVSIAAAVVLFARNQGYGAFFCLFLAFNNWQEIRAERMGANADVFHVDSPEPGGAPPPSKRSRRGRGGLRSVPAGPGAAPGLGGAPDPARTEQAAWGALRAGDAVGAQKLVAQLPEPNAYLRAASALASGDKKAFELYEKAYVAEPNGPPNLVATEVLARAGAATAVAKRLVGRSDGSGRDGVATLQTHLHYASHFQEAAEVGEVVYGGRPASPAQTAFEVACSWARTGDVDRAVSWLDHAADAGFRAASLVDGEPDLETVRADPRWPVVRARLS